MAENRPWYSKILPSWGENTLPQKAKALVTGFNALTVANLGFQNWGRGQYLEQYAKSLYVYACVSKIAEKVGSIDLHLYQIKNSAGDVMELDDHEALDLIYRVNPFQTKSEFLQITIINKLLTGDAFWQKVRDDRGQVVELWNLRPDAMTVIADEESFISGYEFNKGDGTKARFAPEDIVHIKAPSPLDLYLGLSPLSAAKTRVETEQYMGEYQRDFFANNARPDAVLKFPGLMGEEQKREARKAWNSKHQGKGKNSKIALLEQGVEYQQISLSQTEMDYLNSMKAVRDDILVAFKVPKPIVAVLDDVNRANSETAMEIFLRETIKPEMGGLVEKLNEELLAVDFSDTLFFDFDDPTPENREQKLREYESGLTHNYLLINEVRQEMGYEPLTGGWSYYGPIMNVPLGGLQGKGLEKGMLKLGDGKAIENNPSKTKAQKRLELAKAKAFKGRLHVKKKLAIKEKLLNELNKQYEIFLKAQKERKEALKKLKKSGKKAKKGGKKTLHTLFKSTEVREVYADSIFKAIDNRATPFKKAIEKFSREQLARLESAIEDKYGDEKGLRELQTKAKAKVSFDDFLDVDHENKVFAGIALPFLNDLLTRAAKEAIDDLVPDFTFDVTPELAKFLRERSEFLAKTLNNTTGEKVAETITEGLREGEGIADLTDRVEQVYSEFPLWRAEMVARTEATAANNEGFVEAYKQSGIATHKEWIATSDGRTRDSHLDMDGEIVPLENEFSNGLMYPADAGGDPSETINCRCVIAPAFED